MIPDEVVSEIRERADIVSLIGEHVQLKKAGASHKGLCPFHQEKSPSFHVNPARRSFYCFGCQKKGDIFAFLMELQGKSFGEVVREIADRVGVVIPERPVSPEELARRSERARLHEVNAAATAFYRTQLADGRVGAAGRAYLERRGIGAEVTALFQLGLAPDAWDALSLHLEPRKQTDAALHLGLLASRQNNRGLYDRFRNRVMCPVIQPAGEVVGFSGRTLVEGDPETPKYMNSPESSLYRKSNLLFGLHAARTYFARRGRAVLVEGNFDVIALHQAGFSETIAPLGTALTAEQVEILRRMAPQVVLCLDGDKAGRAAALRAIPLLLAAGLDTRVAALPNGEDPDSFVRNQGRPALEELLNRAAPAADYFLDQIWYRTDRSADAQAAALREAAPLLAAVGDEVRRAILLDRMALALQVEPHIIRMAMRGGPHLQAQAAPQESAVTRPAVPSGKPPPPMELKLFSILSDHPDLLEAAEELGTSSLLTDARLRDMYSARLSGQSFLDAAPREISDLVARELMSGAYAALPHPRRTLVETIRELKRDRLEQELLVIARDIKEADRRGETALVRELSIRRIQTRNMAEDLRRRPEEEPR